MQSGKSLSRKKESNEEVEDESNFLRRIEEEGEWVSKGGKELSELRVSIKDLDHLPFFKIFSTFLSYNSLVKNLTLFFELMILFWKSSNSSGPVSSKVKISDVGNLDEHRWNWIEGENLGTKLED